MLRYSPVVLKSVAKFAAQRQLTCRARVISLAVKGRIQNRTKADICPFLVHRKFWTYVHFHATKNFQKLDAYPLNQLGDSRLNSERYLLLENRLQSALQLFLPVLCPRKINDAWCLF
jgi:hypothetical protein